jgi:SAM-dependent methyltransferase
MTRKLKAAMRKALCLVPRVRRPGHPRADDLRAVGLHEDLLLRAVATNVNQNDRALYNLIHAYRQLRMLARSVGEDFAGKTILELGASPEPTLPLILLLEGAEKVITNNVFVLSDTVPRPTVQLLSLLLNSLRDVPPDRLGEVIEWHGDVARFRPGRLECHAPLGAEELPLPEASVDIAFSMAVLEHVQQPRAVLARMFALTKPGGWSLHAIDLRDHRDFTRPLDFLNLSHEEYVRATGGSENRVRARDYVQQFRDAGFEVVSTRFQDAPLPLMDDGRSDLVDMASWPLHTFWRRASLDDVTPWVTEETRRLMAPPFCDMDVKELSVLGLLVIAKKPDT